MLYHKMAGIFRVQNRFGQVFQPGSAPGFGGQVRFSFFES